MKVNKILILYVFFIILPLILPASGFCELKAMDNDELQNIYATGFADFTINDLGLNAAGNPEHETVAWFNVRAFTYTEVDSLKLGYHDEYDYKDPTPSLGWDQDWENITIGTDYEDPSSDFEAEGFYFSAVFENINTPASRELKSVKFGFDYVKGDISADFIKFSGTIDDSNDGTPEYNGHVLNLGPVTITADPGNTGNGGFEVSLNIEDYDKGYWVTFDNAVVTP